MYSGLMTSLLVAMVTVLTTMTHVTSFKIEIQYQEVYELTCYTCPNKGNNRDCNRWAPDIFCPLNATVCKTVHRINRHSGESVQVDKMCALPEQCNYDNIGCTDTDNGDEIECVSCCSFSYCNVQVPHNLTTSFQLSASLLENGTSALSSWPISATLGVTWLILVSTSCVRIDILKLLGFISVS